MNESYPPLSVLGVINTHCFQHNKALIVHNLTLLFKTRLLQSSCKSWRISWPRTNLPLVVEWTSERTKHRTGAPSVKYTFYGEYHIHLQFVSPTSLRLTAYFYGAPQNLHGTDPTSCLLRTALCRFIAVYQLPPMRTDRHRSR